MLWFCLTLVREPHMREFIEELKHRNVIRVGVAYVIAGWLIGLAVAVVWLGWDKLQQPGSTTVSTVDKSIAVLPFDDFSPDGDHT